MRAMLRLMLSPEVPTATVAQAWAARDVVIFLDCREQTEFEVSRLPNAIWCGNDEKTPGRLPDRYRDQTLIVYCSIGKRSESVTKQLRQAGFSDVRNLVGGIFEWVNQGHEVVDRAGTTSRVHTYNRFWSRWLRKGMAVY